MKSSREIRAASRRNACTTDRRGAQSGRRERAPRAKCNERSPLSGVEMRKHIRLLAALCPLCVYGVAQQAGSNNGSSASVGLSATDREPIPAPTSKDFWDGDESNFVNLLTHPFANKKYVQRHTGPILDRLNELDRLTSENGGMLKSVDARAQQSLRLASEKTRIADQHASEASSKAELAHASATEASTRVAKAEQMVGNLDQYQGTSQTEIRFRDGQNVLSK